MYRVMAERAIGGMFEHSSHQHESDAYAAAETLYNNWKFLASVDYARTAVRIIVVNWNGDIIFRFGSV